MATGDNKIFRVTVEQNLQTTVRDGTVLRTDLYRPDVDGLFPTLVCRTPYDKDTYRERGHKMAERGYLVAIQDVRGRYASETVLKPPSCRESLNQQMNHGNLNQGFAVAG